MHLAHFVERNLRQKVRAGAIALKNVVRSVERDLDPQSIGYASTAKRSSGLKLRSKDTAERVAVAAQGTKHGKKKRKI